MVSRLVDDTTKKNIIEEINIFESKEEGGLWECPFCDPASSTYKVKLPPITDTATLRQKKLLIKDHVELHKRDLLDQLAAKREITQYEKTRNDSLKRVRLWITGTISDRRLYEDDPL